MVIDVQLLLSFVNFIILIGICIFYFKKNYVIMDRESYNTMANFIQENCEQEGQEESDNLASGSGFFKEYIEDEEDDE